MERLRSTKVVATIGPACDSVEAIQELIRAGMSVARLNFSHGNHESLRALGEQVRRAASEIGANVALMADTRGPEIRTGPLRDGPIGLVRGALFSLHPLPLQPAGKADQRSDGGSERRPGGRPGDAEGVSVSYARLGRELEVGVSIFLDDGTMELCVESADEEEIRCRVVRGGELGAYKGLSVPSVDLDLPLLGPADLDDLRFIAESDFDYVAASFVRGAEDIESIRRVLRDHGAEIPILAKIEHRRAVENLEALIDAADGTMVARGDLGVELPVERVPIVQKRIIRATVQAGKPVITATQMLDSMVRNPRPTRAEASDVANAILDGTSAVMLSAETATGRHPTEAVRMMATIAREAELALSEYGDLQRMEPRALDRLTDAVAHAATTIASRTEAAAILTLTETGNTSRSISKYRPECPILAVSRSAQVIRRLALNWGVTGLLYEGDDDDLQKVDFGIERAREICARPGDVLVVTAGISSASGSTNLVRIVHV